MMKKIGISACFTYPDINRSVFGPKSLSYIENDMANYLSINGVLPILIPDVKDDQLYNILNEMDGFVFQGGVDLAPESYGEVPIGPWLGDAYRDQYELKILEFAIKNSKPVFGICRGFQLMNVYFGGTLYQDTATQRPELNMHRSASLYDTNKHPILFEKGQLFDRIYSEEIDPHVNTIHHQAIKDLGEDLVIYAKSDDGLIEAFGYVKEPEGKVMGVQWHPEFFHTIEDKLIDAHKVYRTFLEHIE